MAQPLRPASVSRSPARRAFAPLSDQLWHADRDQDLALLTRVNLLVVGAEGEVAEFIAALWPALITPIVVRHGGEPLRLSAVPRIGTFVISGVETLTSEEQDDLHRWLRAGNGRGRVVSSASKALFPMVEAGAFNDGLYYRLNVVTIDLTSPVADDHACKGWR